MLLSYRVLVRWLALPFTIHTPNLAMIRSLINTACRASGAYAHIIHNTSNYSGGTLDRLSPGYKAPDWLPCEVIYDSRPGLQSLHQNVAGIVGLDDGALHLV